MTKENSKALMESLEAYQQNPTTVNELKVALMISIATSLAVIADKLTENEEGKQE